MESLFEINAQVNYKMTVENMRKFGIGPRPATVVVTSILFLFTLLFSAATGILAKGWKVYTIFGAGLLLTFFLPNILTALAFRSAKKRNGGVLPSYNIIVDDKITMQSGSQKVKYEFCDMTHIVHLKYSYKLRFTDRRSLLIDTNCFTKGTFSEFKQFLRTKRPDLNIPE